MSAPDWIIEEDREREAFIRSLDTFPVSDDATTTDVVLDHYLEQLREREAEIARNREVAERRKAMIDQWLSDALAGHEREAKWLRQQIEAFARDYDFGRRKSRSLPHGTIGYRARPDTLEIVDPAAALAFAKAYGLETKETVNKTPLLQYFKAGGVVPDGCEYVEGAETFYVRTEV